MPSSLVVAALGGEAALGIWGVAAVRLVSAIVVSKLLMPDTPEQQQPQVGNRVQVPPATDNKLPVAYGDTWLNPIITDAIISTDNQTMWYVLAFSEKTDSGNIKFDEVYWGDKLIAFNKDNPSEIDGWYDRENNELNVRPAGKVSMWFYNNGSNSTGTQHYVYDTAPGVTYGATTQTAISVLQDPGILESQRWTSSDTMTDTVFAIVRIKYDQGIGLTGLPTITARVNNTLNQPGQVLMDYLKNTRYGCAIPEANLDTASFTALNDYSSETLSIVDGATSTSTSFTRYEVNGVIDTGVDCLTNLVGIADTADSWIQWNEKTGKWGVKINQSLFDAGIATDEITVVTKDNLIGGINVTPLDLNNTYNSFRVTFPNKDIKDQTDFRYYELDAEDFSPNEPANEMNIRLPLCNSSPQAEYIGYRKLFGSRQDYTINFTMDYSGIQIDAGDIIAVNHEWYGWTAGTYGLNTYAGKPFRVTQVKENKDNDGFLSVQITAVSYDDTIYAASQNPHFFTKASFNPFKDPSYISKPGAVSITTSTSTGNNFTVTAPIPVFGQVTGMELWYGTTSTISGNNYNLYGVQYNSGSSLYTNSTISNTQTETFNVVGLPNGNYYFRSRAIGPGSASEFSDVAAGSFISWTQANAINGLEILDNSIAGSKIISGDPTKVGQADSGGFFDNLSPTAKVMLGAAAAYQAYKQGWFREAPVLWDGYGGGEGGGTALAATTIEADTQVADIGDTITVTVNVGEIYG